MSWHLFPWWQVQTDPFIIYYTTRWPSKCFHGDQLKLITLVVYCVIRWPIQCLCSDHSNSSICGSLYQSITSSLSMVPPSNPFFWTTKWPPKSFWGARFKLTHVFVRSTTRWPSMCFHGNWFKLIHLLFSVPRWHSMCFHGDRLKLTHLLLVVPQDDPAIISTITGQTTHLSFIVSLDDLACVSMVTISNSPVCWLTDYMLVFVRWLWIPYVFPSPLLRSLPPSPKHWLWPLPLSAYWDLDERAPPCQNIKDIINSKAGKISYKTSTQVKKRLCH